MATHSRIPTWRTPWTEEPGKLQSLGAQRVEHDWETECAHPLTGSVPAWLPTNASQQWQLLWADCLSPPHSYVEAKTSSVATFGIREELRSGGPCPLEQDPVSPSVSLSDQEASLSLLSFSIRGQTD